VGKPNPVAMRRLLDYLLQKKQARLKRASTRKTAARRNARRQTAPTKA
jgi:hypothetical protein